ncbi:response regulator transcription factor [Streptomyces sp. NPDC050704]|uniref:response regulator transcription factor n=1 Tax=Streptomyces sp. NPDC050704 TaxID=3157219 RepID=UPI00343F4E86
MALIRKPDVAPGPLADLLTALYLLHLRGGEPSMRELADRTRLLSHDTVHRALTRPEAPRWRSLEMVVTALGGDVGHFRDLWVSARLAEEGERGLSQAAEPEAARSRDIAPAAIPSTRPARTQGPTTLSSIGARGGTRVLVVDHHPLWRREVTAHLKAAGYDIVATVDDAAGALREARARAPHVVVTGMHLPDRSGARLCRELRDGDVAARVLVFSASREPEDVRQALASGATGYLLKSSTRDELVDAVRRTAAGEPVFSPRLAGLMRGDSALGDSARGDVATPADGREQPAARLTTRETAVLRLVAGGIGYREVAQRLAISVRTVQNDVQRMLGKLHLRSRLELVRYAVERGLADRQG